MCGRFIRSRERQAYARALGIRIEHLPEEPPGGWPARYNIRPGTEVGVVRASHGGAQFSQLWWGLLPSWSQDPKRAPRPINARAETIAEKPAFRNLLRTRRCLVPADGFYEWQAAPGGKRPYFLRMANGEPFFFAGLWDRWKSPDRGRQVESFTLFTTRPNTLVAQIHDRMPVIVKREDHARWLDPRLQDVGALAHMLEPYPVYEMAAFPVSPAISAPDSEGPELITPIGPPL
jgi:putative SOS response-associated peptidase YedK